jgi:hypothetical protein
MFQQRVLVLLVLATTACTSLPTTDTSTEALFDTFGATYGKVYSGPSELAARFKVFSSNVARVAAANSADPHAQFSPLTRWADMTPEEYAQMHGLLQPVASSEHSGVAGGALPCQFSGGKVPKLSPTAPPLSSLDYVARGATVAVKDQGKCGSCWAHATTAVAESRLKLDTGNITSLSEQFLLDCDPSRVCQGCCGGLSERSLQWLAGDSGGLPREGQGMSSEADYPYSSESGTDPTEGKCRLDPPLVAHSALRGFGVLSSPSDASVVSASTQYGVLSVSMDSRVLQFYKGGIITNSSACVQSNHAVAIVGYGSEGGMDYYKVRNSYGTQFGEEGYFRISRPAAQSCGFYGCVIAGTDGGKSE